LVLGVATIYGIRDTLTSLLLRKRYRFLEVPDVITIIITGDKAARGVAELTKRAKALESAVQARTSL
jgi:hypothetical protein